LIDEKIDQPKRNFAKAKARYDDTAKALEDLESKRRSIQRNERIKAVERSGLTYAEIK